MSKLKETIKKIPEVERLYLHWRGSRNPAIKARLAVLESFPRNSVGVEIGVHEGDYAAKILTIVKPTMLHLIDPWLHFEESQYEHSHYGGLGSHGQSVMDARFERVRQRFSRKIDAGQVTLHRATSEDAVSHFEDDSIDWVYIDGNHQYEFVLSDLRNYYPKVKKGGIIAGDDYGTRDWWGNGVQEAVSEFLHSRPEVSFELVGSQFIIRKG